MKKRLALTQESFDRLLHWLNPVRELGGRKYEDIRLGLITVFIRRGCPCAEDLADETINRVIGKLDEIVDSYTGDPAHYFYGVAQNIFREYLKKRTYPMPAQISDPVRDPGQDYECLERCIAKLEPESRWLILEYHQEDKQAKVSRRKELAGMLNVTPRTLRMRVHRIKSALRECIVECRQRGSLQK